MASIFKRKDTGKWYVQWYYKGKLFRELIGKSKEAAKIRMGEITKKIELGQFSVQSDAPLKDLIDHFKKSLLAEPHSDRTRMRMDNIYNNFEKYCHRKGIERINQVDYPALENYITERITEDGIAPKTANMETNLIRRIFAFAVKHRYIYESPAIDLKQKKIIRKPPRYFSTDEIELLLNNAGRYEAFFMVLLHTGLRASDAAGLKWTDIDLDAGFIRLAQKKTKGGVTIPINIDLKNYLMDYATEEDSLFPDLDRDSKREKVRRYMQKLFRENGYDDKVGCHTFRHTFASQLVIKGASIYDVQKLMGHKSIIMTQVYAHLSEDATRRAVDLLKFKPDSIDIQGLSSAIPRQEVLRASEK